MCPTSPTQHPAPAQIAKGAPEGGPSSNSQDENVSSSPNRTMAIDATNATVPAIMAPAFNPLMIPQLQPIFVVNQFIPFLIGPQAFFPYFPYPFPPWYYFQQPMMNIPVNVQPMPTSPTIVPNGESPIAQNTNMGSGTSITNIMTINEIGNEKGNDNSTNVEIRKNGTYSMSIFCEHGFIDVATGHRNTGSD